MNYPPGPGQPKHKTEVASPAWSPPMQGQAPAGPPGATPNVPAVPPAPPGAGRAPQPKKKMGLIGCLLLGIGGGGLLLLGVVMMAFIHYRNQPEEVVYKKIRHRKTGPSTVTPSGKSGRDMEKPHGVISLDSDDIHLSKKLNYPRNPSICKRTGHLTDPLKELGFEADRRIRGSIRVSKAEELKLGRQAAEDIANSDKFRGRLDTRRTLRWRKYLSRVAQPILAEIKKRRFKYHFHVVEGNTVNAFAIPGGHIYFYTGLLENRGGTWLENEAQLAGILAHEIAHIEYGHTVALYKYMKRFGGTGRIRGKTPRTIVRMMRHTSPRNKEDEADREGTRLLYYAQYSPHESAKMWRNWGRQLKRRKTSSNVLKRELKNLFRSHSDPKKRACTIVTKARKLNKTNKFDRFYVGKKNYRKKRSRQSVQYLFGARVTSANAQMGPWQRQCAHGPIFA